MKTFQVDVTWTVMGGQLIKAETSQEAWEQAMEMPLSSFNGDFLPESFEVVDVEESNIKGG